MINACFLKVAAEVMKVKLTPADIQRVTVSPHIYLSKLHALRNQGLFFPNWQLSLQTVVKAELTVAKGSSPDSQEPDKKHKNKVKTSSSVCSVQ